MGRALVTIEGGMLSIMSKETGGILRPFQLEGKTVSSAIGVARFLTTRGWAARNSGVTCLSIKSRYSCSWSVLPNLAAVRFGKLPELASERDNQSVCFHDKGCA